MKKRRVTVDTRGMHIGRPVRVPVIVRLATDLYDVLSSPLGNNDQCNEEHIKAAKRLYALGWRNKGLKP